MIFRQQAYDRTELSEASLNGKRIAKDAVCWYDPEHKRIENVPLAKDVVQSAVAAHKSYQNRLETQRQEEEAKKRARDLEQKTLEEQKEKQEHLQKQKEKIREKSEEISIKEKQLNEKESKHKKRLQVGLELVQDAQKELSEALEKNDINRVSKAKLMLDSGHKK